MEVDQQILNSLNKTRRWTMFLSIIGFMILGLLIFFGIITGTFLSLFKTGKNIIGAYELLIIALFLVAIIMCFLPVFFLYRFSTHTAKAVHNIDNKELHKAFNYLKSYFVYLGVLIIIALTAYLAVLILAGVSMPFFNGG